MGAPVPVEVIEALAPNRAWRWLSQGADQLFPAYSSQGHGNPATLLARAARGDVPSSISSFAGGLNERLRRLVVTHSWDRDNAKSNHESSASLFFRPQDGGLTEKASYFEWVQDGG